MSRGPALPGGAIERPVCTQDGVTLRAAFWPASGRARGTILVLQGRAEFLEKYAETIADLRARGFAVAAFDWRGQGGSARSLPDPTKGHVADFALYRLDLAAIEAQLLPSCPSPVFGLAHSMGGCIALLAAADGALPVERLVALAPMIDLKLVKHPRTVRGLVRWLARAGLGRRFVPGGDGRSISTLPFPGNRLSADLARYERNAALARAVGAGAIGAPTIGWLAAAYRAMHRLRAPGVAHRIAIPVLLIAAGEDPVCSTTAIEIFGRELATGPALVIPEARHEILMETDAVRATFWQAFDGFVGARAPDSAGELAQHGLVQARVAAGHD